MPYGKTKKAKKYSKKSSTKPWYERAYTPKDLAKKAWSGVKYLKGLVNSELYKFDLSNSSTAITSDSPLVTHLSAIATGDGEGQRTGNSIFVRSIDLKGILTYNSSSTVQAQTCECIIVADSQQIGDTTPAFTDVFSSAVPWAHLNASTVGRFSILGRKRIILEKNGDGVKSVNINVPLKHHIRYNGANSGDVQKGGLYLMMVSDVATASNPPSFSSHIRLSYHDN